MATGILSKGGYSTITLTGTSSAITIRDAYVENGVVFLHFIMTPTSGWNSGLSLGLPTVYYPRTTVSLGVSLSDGADASKNVLGALNNSGTVTVLASSNYTGSVRFTCCYPMKTS